jgi:hypothetical protein
MWLCPKCKARFYNKNQSHSCGDFSLQKFLTNRPEASINLFRHFLSEYRKIGPFDLHVVKTRVALLTKMRFCAINKMARDYIDVHLVLTQPFVEQDCFRKIENIGDRFFVHHLRIKSKENINREVKKFMKLAYDTGNRLHIKKQNR